MARRKIGIVGYFGYGNYGDELFIDVYRKYFYDCEISIIQDSLKSPVYSQQAYNNISSLGAIITAAVIWFCRNILHRNNAAASMMRLRRAVLSEVG